MSFLLSQSSTQKIVLVAILANEEKFLDEWILYHKMIGINHFILYDDNPVYPLKDYLKPHKDYLTIINWERKNENTPEFNNQRTAYSNALESYISSYDWVLFLDADEFVVLREEISIHDFLSKFPDAAAVSLNWYFFGHNGFLNDPEGLITSSLFKRQSYPSKKVKTFTRVKMIHSIQNAHYCELIGGQRITANDGVFGENTNVAYINHYHCRSFFRWMKRAERGDAYYNKHNLSEENEWRLSKTGCFKEFIQRVSTDHNEVEDRYMLRYNKALETRIKKIRQPFFLEITSIPDDAREALDIQAHRIADWLLSNYEIEDLGLYDGSTGVAVFLFHYSVYKGERKYYNVADKVLKQTVEKLSDDVSVCYKNGILGIGAAIQHLILYGLVDFNANELLRDLDSSIVSLIDFHKAAPREIDLLTRADLGLYIAYRMSSQTANGFNVNLNDFRKALIWVINSISLDSVSSNNFITLCRLLAHAHLTFPEREEIELMTKNIINNYLNNIKEYSYTNFSLFIRLHEVGILSYQPASSRLVPLLSSYFDSEHRIPEILKALTICGKAACYFGNPDFIYLRDKYLTKVLHKIPQVLKSDVSDLGFQSGLAGIGLSVLELLDYPAASWNELE